MGQPAPNYHCDGPGTSVVDIVYGALDVAVGALIAWVAFYVIYRLLREDR